ncbi:glucose 1-dehydrogenase [Streptomyces sp. NPDC026672]|uniref:SDR family NAD(P)-dependent oxidoreductase n=1 Tax=unclassified Streptomyces TaxID=2593676 RepID=UPI0033FDE8B7
MASGILQGKTVVVTGGSSGIGRGIALAAARHGAGAVIVADISEDPREDAAPTAHELTEMGVPSRFIKTDVSRRDDVDALVEAAGEFGGVDVMAANAGVMSGADGLDIPADAVEFILSVNLYGALYSAQAAIRQMRSMKKQGSIVITASGGAFFGHRATPIYSASKGGVVLLMKSLADAVGPYGIRVNAVCPGVVDTVLARSTEAEDTKETSANWINTVPLKRVGRPSEIGDAVAFLGSDLATYVTGVALPIDGGLSATR